jgi:hypothetical protein
MRATLLTIALLFAFAPEIPAPQNFSPIPVARSCSVNAACMQRCQKMRQGNCQQACTVCR